jgi:hypothetical protein
MERICTEAMTYRGVHVRVGERFDVDSQDVGTLLLWCRIEPLEGEQGYTRGPVGPIPLTRDMRAGASATYATRDMTAQREKRTHRKAS